MSTIVTPDKIANALAHDIATMRPDNGHLMVRVLLHYLGSVKGLKGWAVRWAVGRFGLDKYGEGLRWIHKIAADHPIVLED